MMTQSDVVEVRDIYMSALAMERGLQLRGVITDDAGWTHFVFDADAILPIFQEWNAQTVPADLRKYLAALRYLRVRMSSARTKWPAEQARSE